MRRHDRIRSLGVGLVLGSGFGLAWAAGAAYAQALPDVDAGTRAFEDSRWTDAIAAYRAQIAADPTNGLAWLRIAQAQRELGAYAEALATLDEARAWNAPTSMVDLERARNLAVMGERDAALRALEAADHDELRALELLEQAPELASLRETTTFKRVHRSVRARVFPCESIAEAQAFDFWVGSWTVRVDDGTRVGHSTIAKRDGGCTLAETWNGAGGSSGTGVTYFMPSKGQWRQVWVGSTGALIDMSGGPVDGAILLEGTIEYVTPPSIVAFRGTWTPLADGRVHQRLEEFDLAGQGWRVWFEADFLREVVGP
jgi:hypothetical protein